MSNLKSKNFIILIWNMNHPIHALNSQFIDLIHYRDRVIGHLAFKN